MNASTGSTEPLAGEPVIVGEDLVKHFPVRSKGLLRRKVGDVHAVCGVTLAIHANETVALVGESGCGKSTMARLMMRLLEPTDGTVSYEGQDLTGVSRRKLRPIRRDIQLVFQDPMGSLNPRFTVFQLIAEPLRVHGVSRAEAQLRVDELLQTVGLNPEHRNRYPHEFSGGQRQRIGVARALALQPKVLILDEPVSALDVSIQAGVINLLEDLQDEFGLSYLFVSHDLSVVRHLADRVAVMYLGKIVEQGTTADLFAGPAHPYTQALMSAIPLPDPRKERSRQRILLEGDVPSPSNPPSGCRFRTRCPLFATLAEAHQQLCIDVEPTLHGDHAGLTEAACHYARPQKLI